MSHQDRRASPGPGPGLFRPLGALPEHFLHLVLDDFFGTDIDHRARDLLGQIGKGIRGQNGRGRWAGAGAWVWANDGCGAGPRGPKPSKAHITRRLIMRQLFFILLLLFLLAGQGARQG